jgi:FG-GAP-like repeat
MVVRMIILLIVSFPSILLAQNIWIQHDVGDQYSTARWFMSAGDINGDGAVDIAAVSGNHGALIWWSNNGDGSSWTENFVSNTFYVGYNVFVEDLDNDGDADIIGVGSEIGGLMRWWENVDGDGLAWVEHLAIPSGVLGLTDAFNLADIDGDGDLDALNSDYHNNGIVWYENIDNGLSWEIGSLDPTAGGISILYGTDLDSDGYTDVICADQGDDELRWWRNVNGDGSVWAESAQIGTIEGAFAAAIDDLDGDGDQDVACVAFSGTNTGQISWWENDGTESFEIRTISNFTEAPENIFAEDFDADGDLDLFVGSRADGLSWWENRDGTGNFLIQHEIDPFFAGTRNTFSVKDFDGDGDWDVAGASWMTSQLVWWEHVSSFGTLTLTRISDQLVPSSGGTVIYDAQLATFLPSPQYGVSYWTEVTLPNGNTIGPMMTIPFNMPPYYSIHVTGLSLLVPAFAPGGVYTFTGNVGYNPAPAIHGSFNFSKMAPGRDAALSGRWATGKRFQR